MEDTFVDSSGQEEDLYYDQLDYAEGEQYIRGGWLRLIVGIILICFGLTAFAIDIGRGYYPLKLFVLGSTCLLIFSPQSYPFLCGVLVGTYFELKPSQVAISDSAYMVEAVYAITVVMAAITFITKYFTGRRDYYQRFDVRLFCLFGLAVISAMGVFLVTNRFLYARRVIEMFAFGCAFYVGRSYVRTLAGLKLLLLGLWLGIFAFILPWTLGYVLREGFDVLGHLHELRGEIGVVSTARESGITIVAFAFAYSISSSGFPRGIRYIALWLVAVPAALATLLFLSRAAIILIPVAIVLTLLFSGRRTAAVWTIIISVCLGIMALYYSGNLTVSIRERMLTMHGALLTRQDIWLSAIKVGILHPLVGVGAGQFRFATGIWHAHNDELAIFAEHGVVALLLYVLFWIFIVYAALRLRLSKDAFMRSFAGAFIVVMACYFVYAQIEPMYFNRGGLLFVFLGGMMTKLYYESRARPPTEEEQPPEFGENWTAL